MRVVIVYTPTYCYLITHREPRVPQYEFDINPTHNNNNNNKLLYSHISKKHIDSTTVKHK